MKLSYNWLQSYFDDKLPEPEKLAELITFSFAEVESIEKRGNGDAVLDVKILPDRACYALSHRGVAYEVAAITGLKRKEMNWPHPEIKNVRPLDVAVESPDLCRRYMARVAEGLSQEALSWVKEHLEAIGQRSINPIVDGANIVMFDMGQPLHAFDADKVEGGIVVRRAKAGETLTTLDDRRVELDESVLVIADHRNPLAIAGIKGGKKAEVTSATKNIILESANFDASYIRKTSERLGIKTDSSKRFENGVSAEYAKIGISDLTAYLFEMDKDIAVSELCDWYPERERGRTVVIGAEFARGKLGTEITNEKIEDVFARLELPCVRERDGWEITPPLWRKDIAIPEDVVEELGRIYGLDNIGAALPPGSHEKTEIPKPFYYEWKIRETLAGLGFSEIITSSLSAKGDIEIVKPLAEDKKYARPNLRGSFEKSLKMNGLNTPLLGAECVLQFEIGNIFTKEGERAALALGFYGPKNKGKEVIKEARDAVSEYGAVFDQGEYGTVIECVLDFEKLPEPVQWDIVIKTISDKKYQSVSPFPFIARDISLFVPPETEDNKVREILWKEAEPLVVRCWQFDHFEKDGKKSVAFRLVFQSSERTLTDEEVNIQMEKAYAAAAENGWEVR